MKNMRMICNEIVNRSYTEKVYMAKGSMKLIFYSLDPKYDKAMTVLFALTIASQFDGYLSTAEVNFINDVTGMTFTKEYLNIDDAKQQADDFLYYLKYIAEEGLKNSFMILMACLCSCDGNISDGELDSLTKTFA